MSDIKLSNLQQAASQLEETKQIVLPLLKDNPAFQLRTQTALDRLIAGFLAVEGNYSGPTANAVNELQPLKSFFGSKIGQKEAPRKVQSIEKTTSEAELLKAAAEKIYPTFLSRDNSEIMEAIPGLEIRSVAKLAGLGWVTSSKPQKIDSKFIDQIKEAMRKKAAQEVEKEFERRAEILMKDHLFTRDSEAKIFTLGDRVVTYDEVLSDEFFNQLIEELNA